MDPTTTDNVDSQDSSFADDFFAGLTGLAKAITPAIITATGGAVNNQGVPVNTQYQLQMQKQQQTTLLIFAGVVVGAIVLIKVKG